VEGGETGDEKEGEEVEPVAARDANIEPDTMVVSLRGGQPTDSEHENFYNSMWSVLPMRPKARVLALISVIPKLLCAVYQQLELLNAPGRSGSMGSPSQRLLS
jgi:hypothetical protein